ncbi:MAG: peptidyl-prolyl cis-trans isomerase [Terriglobales bacterium]
MIKFLQTPGRAKKIVLGGLLVLICVAMVITLIPGGILGDSFGFGAPQGVLAQVGDQDITMVEAQQSARNMARRQFPRGGLDPQIMAIFTQQAVQSLIYEKAMVSEAQRMGLRVSDAELRYGLQHGPLAASLFPQGNFIGQQLYEDFVQQNFGLGVTQFEARLKDELLINKLRNIVEGAASVSDAEVKQEFVRRNTKVKFEYAVLTMDDVMKKISSTDAELKAFYEKNKKNYENSIPEKRKAEYVLIDRAKVKEKVQVTPDDLRRYYNQHQDEYRVPEQVKVRHILIKTPPAGANGKPDEKAVQAARAKAEDVLKKLKASGNFAELAKTYSDDPGSAKQGGELGWITRGRTAPEFEKAAFSLSKGEISGLVQSSFGFHIIQVEDKQQAHMKTLEEVKAQIEPIVAAEKAAQQAESLANTLQTEARATGLEKAAAKQGLRVTTTPLFSRTDTLPGVGSAPEFASAVFAANVKDPAEMVRIPQGYAVFRVLEIKPPATPSFEEAKAQVESDFKTDRARTLLGQKVQELADRAHAQNDLKKAAAEAGARLRTSDLVSMQQQAPEIGSMSGPASVIFELKLGEISGPIHTSGGGGVVAKLLEKQEPPAAEFDKSKDEIRARLLEQKQNEMLDLFISNLRERLQKEGKIKVYKKEMDRLMPKGSEAGS